jgi:uncharacterized membrane protein
VNNEAGTNLSVLKRSCLVVFAWQEWRHSAQKSKATLNLFQYSVSQTILDADFLLWGAGKRMKSKPDTERHSGDGHEAGMEASEDNPRLCNAIEHNIRTLSALRHRETLRGSTQDRLADAITAFSGSMAFVYIHAVIFAVWIALNTGHLGVKVFDPFPFNLLTMVVSLEAIFLSTFVLVSQNRMSAQADKRAALDLHIGLLSEHEITRIIKMLDAIQNRLGIENDADPELAELEKDVSPKDVLREIERIEQRLEKKKAS